MIERTTASSIYAMAYGVHKTGPDRCYYCGASCPREVAHGEPSPHLLRWAGRRPVTALCPGNAYCCGGCQAWRRPRASFAVLGGGVKDNTQAKRHAWYATPSAAWVVGEKSSRALYERLLTPPCRFFLALLEGGDAAPDNLLQLAEGNDNPIVKADTPLHFTVNNIRHTYTVYELQQAVRGDAGREPGVRALVRLLGPVPTDMPEVREPETPPPTPPGKPKLNDHRVGADRRLVRKSGG